MLKEPGAGVYYYRRESRRAHGTRPARSGCRRRTRAAVLRPASPRPSARPRTPRASPCSNVARGLRIVDPNLRSGLIRDPPRRAGPRLRRLNGDLAAGGRRRARGDSGAGGAGKAEGSGEARTQPRALRAPGGGAGTARVVVRGGDTCRRSGGWVVERARHSPGRGNRSDRRRRCVQCRLHRRPPSRRQRQGGARRRNALRCSGNDGSQRHRGVSSTARMERKGR
jgi:hypothetical protein